MKRVLFGSVAVLVGVLSIDDRALSQIIPDNTLGTQVNQAGAVFQINNGMRSGNNLFHSFSQFSVPTNGSAIFNNATDVQNIFSRVTGSQLSNIDGILKTQGSANLFLMNPNGIIFGPNAQLQLGGSFLGTTANSIRFADGIEFNSVNATPALLSVKVPIGLQMGNNPNAISIQGNGHQLKVFSTFAPIVGAGQQNTGLQVKPNQTLALIGGDIQLSGGILSAPSGQIELGGAANGTVNLATNAKGFTIGYEGIRSFRDLKLTNASAIDASGVGNATVQLVGQNIDLTNGSIALIVNQAPQMGGNLRVNASDSFQLSGRSPSDPKFGSFLVSDAFAGSSANISITASSILMHDRGIVAARTFGNAVGGNINVKASTIQIDGEIDRSLELHSGFLPTSLGQGNVGSFTLSANQLTLLNGGYINVSTVGSGNASEVAINADTIRIDGSNSLGQSSLIAAAGFSSGNAGNVTINTRAMVLSNGGTASTSTFDRGNAGNLTINASESLTITGRMSASPFSTTDGVGSSANILPPAIRKILRLPDRPSGNSGDVIITTNRLSLLEGGEVKVNNQGSGNAGTIKLQVPTIVLNDKSSITAASTSGIGGNIVLETQKLLMRNQSSITTTARDVGNGGNISITAPILVGLENSDISANATLGQGGRIQITTQRIIGLQYRPALTPESDITASSEFGIDGNVQVNMIGINPANTFNALPSELHDSSRQIFDRCGNAKNSSFIFTRRGGMPQDPTKRLGSDRSWTDLRNITNSSLTKPVAIVNPIEPILEANILQIDDSGSIALVAATQASIPKSYPTTCSIANTTGEL